MKIGIVENEKNISDYLQERITEMENVHEVRSWSSAEDVLRDVSVSALDLLLIDIGLGGMDGITLTGILSQKYPHIKKVILSSMNSEESVFNALKNGAIGYISKSEIGKIEENLQVVLEGGAIISPTIALRVLDFFRTDKPETLQNKAVEWEMTAKEKMVLDFLVEGLSPLQIAEKMQVKITTVRFHIRGIYKKMEVKNRTDLLLKLKSLGVF